VGTKVSDTQSSLQLPYHSLVEATQVANYPEVTHKKFLNVCTQKLNCSSLLPKGIMLINCILMQWLRYRQDSTGADSF